MSNKLYEQSKYFFPDLKDVPLPSDLTDFDTFFDWINTNNAHLQALVFEEFYENKIDECRTLLDAGINVVALQNQIDQTIERINSEYSSADNMDDYEGDILDIEDRHYDAFFDQIQRAAEEKELTTLVVLGENPYWMVVKDDQEAVVTLIDAFNENFKDSSLELSEVE